MDNRLKPWDPAPRSSWLQISLALADIAIWGVIQRSKEGKFEVKSIKELSFKQGGPESSVGPSCEAKILDDVYCSDQGAGIQW